MACYAQGEADRRAAAIWSNHPAAAVLMGPTGKPIALLPYRPGGGRRGGRARALGQ